MGEINWPSRQEAKIRALLSLPLSGIWGPRHQGLCPWARQEEAAPWEGRAWARALWGRRKEEIRAVRALHRGGSEPLGSSAVCWGGRGWVKVTCNGAQKQHLKPQGWCHTPAVPWEGRDMAGPSQVGVWGFADLTYLASP